MVASVQPGRESRQLPVLDSSREMTMLNMSRRDFVVSTGLAAALGLNARLVVTPAYAQKTPDPAKPFVTYKVGTAEVTAIYDGIWEKAHDPAFISNASVDDVKAAMVKAGLPADFVSIPFTVARSSTFALSNVTAPYVLAVADKGCTRALSESPYLRAGLNIHDGEVTHKAVAEALELPYVPASEALKA